MKRYFFLSLIIICPLSFQIKAQCKVLADSIVGNYEGDCKKGIANGFGKATGKDTYEGEFKKGLPHGKGVYKWSNGNSYDGEFKVGKMDGYGVFISVVNGNTVEKKGYWKFGYYGGENKNVQVYKIKNKKYITDFSVKRVGDGNKISFKWVKGSRVYYTMSALNLSGSSGIQATEMNFCGFNQVKFPFTCQIEFQNTDKSETMTYDCLLDFEIIIPGEYEITFKD